MFGTGSGVVAVASSNPSRLASVNPSIIPSPFASVPPASITSTIPSLSESKSNAFDIPSPSESQSNLYRKTLSIPTSFPAFPFGWKLSMTMLTVDVVATKSRTILFHLSSFSKFNAADVIEAKVLFEASFIFNSKSGKSVHPSQSPATSTLKRYAVPGFTANPFFL